MVILNSKVIDNIEEIDTDSRVLQLGVYKDLNTLQKHIVPFLNNYDIYVEKINNYTAYVVNLKTRTVPKDIKKIYRDAFFINKSQFKKNELVQSTQKEPAAQKKPAIQNKPKSVKPIKNHKFDALIKKYENIINMNDELITMQQTQLNTKDTKIGELNDKIYTLEDKIQNQKETIQKYDTAPKEKEIQIKEVVVKEKSNIFQTISLFNQFYKVDKSNTQESSQNVSTSGFAYKIGFDYDIYNYNVALKFADNIHMLAGFDYIFSIDKNNKIITGINLGYGMYEVADSSFYLNGVLYGVNLGYVYKNYTLGANFLKSNMKATKDSVDYKIDTLSSIYLEYKF
jgi:hypothetical protein